MKAQTSLRILASCQSLPCSLTQYRELEEASNKESEIWPHWIAPYRSCNITNNMACVPSEDSDQPLIRVFAVRMKKHWPLSHLLSAVKTDQTGWMFRLICLRQAHIMLVLLCSGSCGPFFSCDGSFKLTSSGFVHCDLGRICFLASRYRALVCLACLSSCRCLGSLRIASITSASRSLKRSSVNKPVGRWEPVVFKQ